LEVDKIEALCKEMSTKEVKKSVRDKVSFDYKIKGKKPVVTNGVLLFSLTGENFNLDKLAETL